MAKTNERTRAHERTEQVSQDDELHKLFDRGNRWSGRLHRLNGTVEPEPSHRQWAAREYVRYAGEQLVKIGDSDGSNMPLLMGRLCNSLRVLIGRPETRELLKALRQAAHLIEKVIPTDVTLMDRLLATPERNEHSLAAIALRDNIAKCLDPGKRTLFSADDLPDSYRGNDLEAVVAMLSAAVNVPDFFGNRLLINTNGLKLNARQERWKKKANRELDRADVTTPRGRLEAATRIVKQCAKADGMTATQAENLFKNDNVTLSGKQQVKKKVRSRD